MKRDSSELAQPSIEAFLHKKQKISIDLTGSRDGSETQSEASQSEPKKENLIVDPNDDSYQCEDAWDSFHVKLPCSPSHQVRLLDHPAPIAYWKLICQALQRPMKNAKALKDAIISYNPKFEKKWDFLGLLFYFEKILTQEERDSFFQETLPFIIETALALPDLFKKPIPLLMKHVSNQITLSRHQVACLLANMFLCTFPKRSTSYGEYEYYPTANFNSLYSAPCTKVRQHKLKCIIHYFKRLEEEIPRGAISFSRQVIEDFPEWQEVDMLLSPLNVFSSGTIEEDGSQMLQVDFANKYIGGGVLGNGCVQEEIRFLISPELIVSRLFCAELDENESLIITGSERFSMYTGYAKTFEWVGDYRDMTERDENFNIKSSLLAIDALDISRNPLDQYSEEYIQRELNKAYSGFYTEGEGIPIASGNWGCGVFGGHKHLKSLIQIMAASSTGRQLNYFTFGDNRFCKKLQNVHRFLVEKKTTIQQLYKLIEKYAELVFDPEIETVPALFKFIKNTIDGKEILIIRHKQEDIKEDEIGTEENNGEDTIEDFHRSSETSY
jgi:poly(ADP-ribose) glycohydrolase